MIEHLEEAMEDVLPKEKLGQGLLTSSNENSCAASSTIMLAFIVKIENSECISGNTTTLTSEGTNTQSITARNDEQRDNDNFIDDNPSVDLVPEVIAEEHL